MSSDTDVKNHLLWSDFEGIFKQKNPGQNIHLTGELHTVKEDIPIFKVLHAENNRNYAKETSEFFVIHTYMGAGDYLYRVYPYRDNLEVSIKTTWLNTRGEINPDKPPKVLRY